MNSRWRSLASLSPVVFAGLVIGWQLLCHDGASEKLSSVVRSCLRGQQLAEISSIEERDREISESSRSDRHLDLILPKDARVFLTGMTGPTNYSRIGYYYYLTYYLFPREVGVSVDQPTRITKDGLAGRTTEFDQEIAAQGYNVRIDIEPGSLMACKTPIGYPLREASNPDWFNSNSDTIVALLLPLLTALAGMWLFRFLFRTLTERMPLLEQLAYGLGLGMMAVAALTLGVKLCSFHGRGLIFLVTAAGGIAEIWRDRKALGAGITAGCRKVVHHPLALAILVTGALVFLILFRLASLEGVVDPDAAMAWLLKAKIMHLNTGGEMVQWFSNPRLAGAHLDYPTLVPALHTATYDSLGHVDEFVTKFWPVWMLLFLLTALASLNCRAQHRLPAPCFFLLALLLLPAFQQHVQYEGGPMPMIFFTTLGLVQCAIWLAGKDRARLGLGLTLLFGAAMTKFEGFIFLALAGGWMWLLPSARPALKLSSRFWRVLTFCLLAALPFVCLRSRIPALQFESGWAGYALHHPGGTLSNWPGIFMILLSQWFVSYDFARWSGEGGQLHWIGRWDGLSSLYNHPTLGLAWYCLLMTLVLWFAIPARRTAILWLLSVVISTLAAFSIVFASFVSITSLTQVMGYTSEQCAGRYLLPVLLAWFATIMTLFFMNPPASASTAGREATAPLTTASVNPSADKSQSLPI